ncbi:MAG: TolC family protein [Planctomycetota bacterium]
MNRTRDGRRALGLGLGIRLLGSASLASAALVAGCGSPIRDRAEEDLRASVTAALKRELDEAERFPARRMLDRTGDAQSLEIRPEHLEEIDELYNPDRYFAGEGGGRVDRLAQVSGLLADDFYGEASETTAVGLRAAIELAVTRNLVVQEAGFGPVVAQADIVTAEAAFDAVFFTDVQWTDTDAPTTIPNFIPGGPTRVTNASQSVTANTGIRRALTTGGSFTAEQRLSYTDERGTAFGGVGTPNPASAVDFVLGFEQPLLQGFGPDVALAEVRLGRNAERVSVSQLRQQLLDTVTETERAYWELVRAHRELVITARLVERGETVREEIKARRVLDAVQAQVADAVSAVESRRADLLRAQRAVRRASDALKVFMNDPRLPVGSETVLVPTDATLDQPIVYSFADALDTAVSNRPEVAIAVLSIDDASIRQAVADNGRLPTLDLRAEMQLRGFDGNLGDAYGDAFDNEFVDDFFIGALFEQAIGNRADEAAFRRARLERMRSVVAYRQTIQSVVLDVKNALDDVVTNYKLIEQARLSRIAAAEALRTLLVEKELTDRGFTVERLDLELNQQEALAAAERAEVAALIDYQIALAELSRATGITLERNRIDFVVPDANQIEKGNFATDYQVPDADDSGE